MNFSFHRVLPCRSPVFLIVLALGFSSSASGQLTPNGTKEVKPTYMMYSFGVETYSAYGLTLQHSDSVSGVSSNYGPYPFKTRSWAVEARALYHALKLKEGVWLTADASMSVGVLLGTGSYSDRFESFLSLKYTVFPTLYLGGVAAPDARSMGGLFFGLGPILTRVPWVDKAGEDSNAMRLTWGLRAGYSSGLDSGGVLIGGLFAVTFSPGVGEQYTLQDTGRTLKAGWQFGLSYSILLDSSY